MSDSKLFSITFLTTVFCALAADQLDGGLLPTLPAFPTLRPLFPTFGPLPTLPPLLPTFAPRTTSRPLTHDSIVERYKCALCKSVLYEHIVFAKDELRLREEALVKFCDKIVQKVLKRASTLVCRIYFRNQLRRLLTEYDRPNTGLQVSERMCNSFKLCKKV